jgi:hypothetical protein
VAIGSRVWQIQRQLVALKYMRSASGQSKATFGDVRRSKAICAVQVNSRARVLVYQCQLKGFRTPLTKPCLKPIKRVKGFEGTI